MSLTETAKSNPNSLEIRANNRPQELLAKHKKLTVASTDMGTYDINYPAPKPNTSEVSISISELSYIFQTNAIAHKAANLRANRVIGDGFELLPSDDKDVPEFVSQRARNDCWRFLQKINYRQFFRQSCINAYSFGNEWSEILTNPLGRVFNVIHGDAETIDFRRNFINNKIIIDSDGEPSGYWQYIADLSQLYFSLASYYGDVPSYENLQAAKERLEISRALPSNESKGEYIFATDPITGQRIEVGAIFYSTTKPNYQLLKKDEIAHLAFTTANDNFYGISLFLPAYNSLNLLEQVMYATAEAISSLGFPKPVVYMGNEKISPDANMAAQAQAAITDPTRKESFVLPYYFKMEYLQSNIGTNIANYPEWFVNEVAMGLRTPKELLLGSGESNRSTAETNSSDFDRDIQADRNCLEKYIYKILAVFLRSRGYFESEYDAFAYLPKIKWNALITADEALREKMATDQWNNDAITFNEYRRALKLDEIEDRERGDKYKSELNMGVTTGKEPFYNNPTSMSDTFTTQDGIPTTANPFEDKQTITAKHKLDPKEELNPSLNKYFGTEGVDYKKVAQKSVGTEIISVGEKKAREIRDAIVNGEAQKKSAKKILAEVKEIGGYTEEKARVILVTEHKNLAEHGSVEDAKKSGYKYKKWLSVMDKDTSAICKALHNKVVPIDDDFKVDYTDESGNKKSWSGKAPSAHPSCRSILSFMKEKEG